MESISKRLREIDKELADLYREKRILEMEQQEHWRKMGWTGPIVAKREDYENFEEFYCPGIEREDIIARYKKPEYALH